MRWLVVAGAAACGAPPAPHLHFAGEPEHAMTASSQAALTALAGGEIAIESSWQGHVPLLAVECEPACAKEPRGFEQVIVHPLGIGQLVVHATVIREDNHETMSATRTYDVVRAEDIALVCRDAHGAVLECDVPQHVRTGTAEVVAVVGGKIIEHVAGMRVDGKPVAAGPFVLSEIVDAKAPGLHTVTISGGGVRKSSVIAVAPD